MTLRIDNRTARRLWLATNGLAGSIGGRLTRAGLAEIIDQLGFVQLDTVRVVARAHDHILWSRNRAYREPMLWKLLADDRAVFEHFTHDASILPMSVHPYWTRQYRRLEAATLGGLWGASVPPPEVRASYRQRIAEQGPLSVKDFAPEAPQNRDAWKRTTHKAGLDHMWYAGELATAHRRNFVKFYDLADRVIPASVVEAEVGDAAQVDWLCRNALARLGFATEGEVQRFWNAASLAEVRAWTNANRGDLVPVEIGTAEKTWTAAFAPPDIETRLAGLPPLGGRLRILNPFDPAIRDRDRLKRLFGFDYRIEIFTPAEKRRYGYYVFPLLEGDRFVGRIEAKADRKAGVLAVDRLWREPGVRPSIARAEKLEVELQRFGRLAGVEQVVWRADRADRI